ncbi:MAG TPA: helix-turn-helix transcriptional regulator [Rhizobiaceae bacterium]|nr:helix-turn-helix transcriptional regulator [Rhizobiaceae bacterium]
MLSHERVWQAIDALAQRNSLSASGLAKRAGLDPTTFNKSKRFASDGRARWPSTESLSKIMAATGSTLEEFIVLVRGSDAVRASGDIPLIGLAQAGAGGFFDDAGFPAGQGWDVVDFPGTPIPGAYALEISGDSMLPLYRHGDIIIVSPGAAVRRGDRVVVKTRDGEVTAKILQRQTTRLIELRSTNPEHPNRTLDLAHVEWMARILWVSQ